eukprot:m.84008 g.84008  ORF g.84008 m.84008 type:complete len:81 (-) comp12140_c2_seq4:231-473(-)
MRVYYQQLFREGLVLFSGVPHLHLLPATDQKKGVVVVAVVEACVVAVVVAVKGVVEVVHVGFGEEEEEDAQMRAFAATCC